MLLCKHIYNYVVHLCFFLLLKVLFIKRGHINFFQRTRIIITYLADAVLQTKTHYSIHYFQDQTLDSLNLKKNIFSTSIGYDFLTWVVGTWMCRTIFKISFFNTAFYNKVVMYILYVRIIVFLMFSTWHWLFIKSH